MSGSNGNRRSLNLSEARELTPPVNPVEAMRKQLALALFDAVKPQDVIDLALKLKEQAMAGDLKAAKLYLDLMLGKDSKPVPPQSAADSGGLKMMAEALRDLVDEIRIGKAKTAKREQLTLNGAGGED